MGSIELVKLNLQAVLVNLESTQVPIGLRFSVICVAFCRSCRFGELGERKKRISIGIDRACRAQPGTRIR